MNKEEIDAKMRTILAELKEFSETHTDTELESDSDSMDEEDNPLQEAIPAPKKTKVVTPAKQQYNELMTKSINTINEIIALGATNPDMDVSGLVIARNVILSMNSGHGMGYLP